MKPYHAVLNVSFEAENLQDAFNKLVKIAQSRRNYINTDDEAQLEAGGVVFMGMIDVHAQDECPYDDDGERKQPWQQ